MFDIHVVIPYTILYMNKIKSKLTDKYKLTNVVTIDCGKNIAYYYNPMENKKESVKVTHEELLELPKRFKNTLFVSESAHLDRPRTMKSFAQPFKVEELKRFKQMCKDNGNILRLFPEMLSYDVISDGGMEKSDENDPISLYQYLEKNMDIIDVLKNPSEDYEASELRKEGWEIKSNMNMLLNYARRNDYGKDDVNDNIRNWLKDNIDDIVRGLDDNTKVVFGLDNVYKMHNVRKGIRRGDVNLNAANMTAIYSIAAGLFEFNISKDLTVEYVPRLREQTDKLPGWKFLEKYVYGFSPFHLNGGLARSNLKFHNFNTYLGKRAVESSYCMIKKKLNGKPKHQFDNMERQFFRQVQNEHKKACKQLYLSFKRVMENPVVKKPVDTNFF
jgi:hypothetical protein